MAVPKKRTSRSKKRIRQNIWKRKGYSSALKAFSLGQSIYTDTSKSFFCDNKRNPKLKMLKIKMVSESESE